MAEESSKRTKKIQKSIVDSILTIKAGENVMKFDINSYPKEIRAHLELHGLSQKLGDAAAGATSVTEAVDCIQNVNEHLIKGVWTTRQPAYEKLSKREIIKRYNDLSDEEKESVKPGLKKMGLII